MADLKAYLSSPPLISILEPHKQLFVYFSSSTKSVSATLIRENEGVQKPIYYVSKCLVGDELNYLPIEKLVLTLITASRRLHHYFDVRPIKVLTSTPMKASLRRSDLYGQMEKWSVELGRFHIEYEPRTAIKGQVLADFIAENIESPYDPTGGHQEATVALAGLPTTPTGGQEGTDIMDIDNVAVQQNQKSAAEQKVRIKKTNPELCLLMDH